jgi:hypothetical protein
MKASANIAIIAVILVGASAGVLYPLHGSIGSVRKDVGELEAELAREQGGHAALLDAYGKFKELQDRIRQRAYRLCPGCGCQRISEAGIATKPSGPPCDAPAGASPCPPGGRVSWTANA